jgi:hypothetical protein
MVAGVLATAVLLGYKGSLLILVALVALLAGFLLLRRLWLGLLGVVALALIMPVNIPTGTEVVLNPVTLVVPLLFGLWLLRQMGQQDVNLVPSRVNRPLLLFLGAGLLSLLIGNALWDVAVPRAGSFWLVQLAQWGIFAFSALAFWLMGNVVKSERQLLWVTVVFLAVAGGLAIVLQTPLAGFVKGLTTVSFIRASFWIVLTALAAGQLLFNEALSAKQRLVLLLILGATLYYAFVAQQEAASNWVGLTAVIGTLLWLRWAQFRVLIGAGLLVVVALGVLFPAVYDFAGGDDEWTESGGSRVALITRVVADTVTHNPVTGLGPAAYRAYGATRPLLYLHIVWTQPRISSHNNYVDLFAHTGIVGLSLFFWFGLEYALLGLRLRRRFRRGFTGAYVNSMLALGAGSLTIMLLADWILPFVYNIGFPGFQASILVWLFLGGLVALEQLPEEGIHTKAPGNKDTKGVQAA